MEYFQERATSPGNLLPPSENYIFGSANATLKNPSLYTHIFFSTETRIFLQYPAISSLPHIPEASSDDVLVPKTRLNLPKREKGLMELCNNLFGSQ